MVNNLTSQYVEWLVAVVYTSAEAPSPQASNPYKPVWLFAQPSMFFQYIKPQAYNVTSPTLLVEVTS